MSQPPTRRRRGDRPLDPGDLSLFSNLFASVAEEMGASLIRSAYSPNIKERRDCSCALFDGDGLLIAQAAHIPVHLGAMPQSVGAALASRHAWRSGDAVLLNDPFSGGTHLPDLTVVTPVLAAARSREPFAFLASRAHHADVGGMTPGSLPLSREICQEGLRLPPVPLRIAGQLNAAVLEVLYANTRTPVERKGDLSAQLAAHDVGEARLQALIRHYRPGPLAGHMQALRTYGRRLMEGLLADIPDGDFAFEDVLDGDGVSAGPLTIRAELRVRGRRVAVDFAGSSAACDGNLNAVEAITCSAVYYCFLALLVTRAGFEDDMTVPLNAGCFEPITVLAPRGTVVSATAPHAVAAGNLETSQRIVDVVLGALAEAVPQWIPAASQGTMNNLTLGSATAGGVPFAYYETQGGGMGGSPAAAGLDAVQVHMTNTRNTPIEALELAYPLRIGCYQIIRGSGGAGRHRGGHGLRRDVEVLCNASGSLLSDRREHPPYGLAGGAPGRCGRNFLISGGRRRRLPGKVQLDLLAGDVISIETPGGGGWGQASD